MSRWRFRILLTLALGVLTTLALAWAAPLVAQPPPRNWSNPALWIDDSHAGHYQVYRGTLADSVRLLHILFSGAPKDQSYYKATPPPPWAFKLTHGSRGDGPASNREWWGVDTIVTGWPLRAFRGAIYEPWPTQRPATPAIILQPDPKGTTITPAPPTPLVVGLYRFGGTSKDRYALPLRPIGPGLAANIATFTAAWAILWLAFSQARTLTRRIRGRCPACNYDLRGLAPGTPCPECGRAPVNSPVPGTLPP